jgi:hypothetical protein
MKLLILKHGPKVVRRKKLVKELQIIFVTPHTNFNRPTPPRTITYPETCTWYGALTFAKETGDKS